MFDTKFLEWTKSYVGVIIHGIPMVWNLISSVVGF